MVMVIVQVGRRLLQDVTGEGRAEVSERAYHRGANTNPLGDIFFAYPCPTFCVTSHVIFEQYFRRPSSTFSIRDLYFTSSRLHAISGTVKVLRAITMVACEGRHPCNCNTSHLLTVQ